MNKLFFLTACLLFFSIGLCAQRSFVLWDKANAIPVSMASVYTTCGGNVKNVFSDREGRVDIDFSFDSITVSHINYQRLCMASFPDTVFMEQTIRILPEVTVSGGEPEWIRPLLMDFVRTREERYRGDAMSCYEYLTQNVGDTVLYRFESKGC